MKNTLRKISAILISVLVILSLASCGETKNNDTISIAIVKQMDHPSLDEIADAIAKRLDEIETKEGVAIEYEIYSGQGDQSILKQIGDTAIANEADAIIPVATTAAQIMAVCAEDTRTLVIFAAVSDPEGADLTGIEYVTGTSDALNTEFIMKMMFAQNPEITKVGLLYSLSEPNSEQPVKEAKAYLDGKNITYTEATGNTTDEVIAAVSVLVSNGVDVIFTPTDNIIMSAEPAIIGTLTENNIPHYTGADSFVRSGAFATCGVNYTDLGTDTAELAFKAITEGFDNIEDYYKIDGGIITVNTETAAELNIDYSVFGNMGTVVEVTTTEE